MPTSNLADTDCSAHGRLRPGPFSSELPASPLSADALEASLDAVGIRLLPYPFASAFAVASDVDGSSRETFDGYTNMLVHDLGLDFGDSSWLHWRYSFNANGVASLTNSGGFLSPSLTERTDDDRKFFRRNRSFLEILSDYHEGSVDHYHAFLPHGPRVAVLTDISRDGALLTADIPPLDVSCGDFHIFAVCLVFPGGTDPGVRSVRVESAGGETFTYQPAEHDAPADGHSYFLFLRDVDPESLETVPHLRQTARIVAELSDDAGPVPTRIILVSTNGRLLLDRLNFLRSKYHVEMPLITEHATLHFRSPAVTERVRARNTLQYEAQAGSLSAFFGPLADANGTLIATVDSDEPHSLARVLPEAVEEAELRFIVPFPASRNSGFHVTELLARSPTRSGGGFYWAHRTLPNLTAAPAGKIADGQTKHDTFAARVERAIEFATKAPGGFWPIYTHIGSLARIDGRRIDLPDPYFEPGPLLALQDRAFGISPDQAPDGRIWFARASTLYDYALILQGVAGQVERNGDGSIDIRSWHDPVLGKQLPRAPSHLFGLTFHVEDEANATVTLDGAAIEDVCRNRADSTGSASVTIAECDISSTLFRAADPSLAPGSTLTGGAWEWREGGSPAGCLTVAGESGLATLRVPMHGARLPGAQLLSFRLRAGADWTGGVLFETRTGGRFWFGSDVPPEELGEIIATYGIDRLAKPDTWLRVVVPFYDLTWSGDARPGGPLPSHSLEAITLVAAGAAGSAAEFGDMRLLRPRVSRAARYPDAGHCVIGFVRGAGQGETVQLYRHGEPDNATATSTDQLGWFVFPAVAPGVYRITASRDGIQYQSARGPAVEVWSDIPRLELVPATADGEAS